MKQFEDYLVNHEPTVDSEIKIQDLARNINAICQIIINSILIYLAGFTKKEGY